VIKSEDIIIELFGKMPYKPLVEEIKDFAIFHLDKKGHVLSWNKGAEIIFGYSKDEIIGQDFSILFTAEDQAQRAPEMELKKAQETGRAEDTRWHLRKDNSVFFASGVTTAIRKEDGTLLGFAKIARDETERRQIEEAYRESEERYRLVAETASDAIISINEQSTILFVNPAAERIFGHKISEMLGQQLTMLMPEYLHYAHQAGVNRYLKTGVRHLSWERVEVPGLHREGHEIPLELSFGEYRRGNERVFIGIARDISQRRVAEAEREQLLQREQEARFQAEEANRIKDDFLATLSHELRTPLNAILGWTKMLQTQTLDSSSAAKALEIIERNARVQTQLIEDLLDVSRIITGKLRLDIRPLDLNNVIMAAVEAVQPAAEAKQIQLQTLLNPEAGKISGDFDRLQQVVWNLLSNAVKFTSSGGIVQVKLEKVNSHVEVTVSDTGMGIAEEFLPFVFERFRQVDASLSRYHGGLGLGLAIVRQLVELHGGMVSAESQGEGQGSTFKVTLPLFSIRTEESEIQPIQRKREAFTSPDCPPEISGIRALIVDDDPDSLDIIELMLSSCGAETITAKSASEAFELVQQQQFDVIISDIGMPGEDGFSLISRIRKLPADRGANIPAIALTAYAREEDKKEALRAGFQLHISKPFEQSEIVAAVARLAGRDENSN
jgi:PAS domain S-box-containing protein